MSNTAPPTVPAGTLASTPVIATCALHGTSQARQPRSTMDTSQMRARLDEFVQKFQLLLPRIQLRTDLLASQVLPLTRYANDPRLPQRDRQTAAALAEDTGHTVSSHRGFLAGLHDMMGLLEDLRRRVNTGGPHYPASPEAQEHFALVEALSRNLATIDSILRNLDALSGNTNFLDRQRAIFGPASTGTDTIAPHPNDTSSDSDSSAPGPDCPQGSADGTAGSGVSASEQSAPGAYDTVERAVNASPDSMARFFGKGAFVHGNMHQRKRALSDGNYVILTAYTPELTTSSESDAYTLFGGAGVGAVLGASTGNPALALLGALAGLATIGFVRKPDAVYQGYKGDFYRGGTLWQSKYFYGTRRSSDPGTAIALNGQTRPELFCNLADQPFASRWSVWKTGGAIERPAAAAIDGVRCCHLRDATRLIQAGAAFSPTPAAHNLRHPHAIDRVGTPAPLARSTL